MTKSRRIESMTAYMRFIEQNCTSEIILFRGQRRDLPLLPKIARIDTISDLVTSESDMLKEFKRLSHPFLTRVPANSWEWLALAQHHGMATRLLDWTLNPLSALWFTVQNPPVSRKNGVVWIFEVPKTDIVTPEDIEKKKLDPFSGGRTKVFQPTIITSRIQAQIGWFTVHKFIESYKKFIAFETNKIYLQHLTKLIIPASKFSQLRYQLDRAGINKLTQFPDLDGCASHVQWLNSFSEDEKDVETTERKKKTKLQV